MFPGLQTVRLLGPSACLVRFTLLWPRVSLRHCYSALRGAPGRDSFPSSGSSVHEPLSSALHGNDCSPRSLAHARSRLDLRPVLSPSCVSYHAPSAPDLNSSSTSTFPRTGLTSAYPRRYPGPLLLEPSFPSALADGFLLTLSGHRRRLKAGGEALTLSRSTTGEGGENSPSPIARSGERMGEGAGGEGHTPLAKPHLS